MDNGIIIAFLSLAGTLFGTFGGIVASSKLTNFRLAQLEDKVNKHNNLIDRTYKIEERLAIQEQKLCTHEARLTEYERNREP